MNTRGVWVQGVLAVAGLVAAFLVWQREPEGIPGEVTVLDVSKRSLQRVRYEDASRTAELYRDPSDEETIWLRLGNKPPPPPAVATTDAGPDEGGVDGGVGDAGPVAEAPPAGADAGVAAPPPPPRELRGNETAKNLFARLVPLKATRALGELDAKKQEELGLTNSPRKLTLTVDGREESFTLASPSGTSWGSPYLRREDGRVFLLGPALLPDLENASSRLVDRRKHTFEMGDFDAFTVFQGKASRAFVVNGKPPSPVTVAPQGSPDKQDEFVRNWFDRVWRLVPSELLGKGEEPPGGAPEEVFRVEFRKGETQTGFATVARGVKGDFYLRTEHLPGWAKLPSGVDTLASEAVKVSQGH
ncbi:hypothetical protein [Stigmatella aurantiaca]|uniref:Conserved uncharacterized protein n=1 Tax=Stigmatella aurantiaca (strain DW4/3-1) TaxID=378806 RepID=Q09CW5_STIAD|nr:hypothetical protein [Stigmatella aurantiaca]ADO70123.1 conserved uncharacterized protein [Stigmatella aurantiaca DW4/3-1]EAU69502.1 hypothetical protein STIAU_2010 [Stigmatella aurantiaca DW4/3-1]